MLKTAKRLSVLLLAGSIGLATASTARAADTIPQATSSLAAISTRPTEVPVKQEAVDLDGFKYITKVFEVSGEVLPETLIEFDFEKDGFIFKMDSIVKDILTGSTTKNVASTYEANSVTNDVWEVLKSIPATIDYDESGYAGNLYLLPNSLNVFASEFETKKSRWSITDSIIKQVEYNDESEFPATVQKNGYTLSRTGLTFQEGEYLPDSAIPSYYIGTATYGRTLSSSKEVPTGYTVTARYTGEVTKEKDPIYVYTITYRGEAIKADFGPQILMGLIWLAIAVLLAVGTLLVLKVSSIVRASYVKVEAQDEDTGEYVKIQSMRIDAKTPTIELDVLKAPAAKHFLVTISKSFSEKIKGKIVMVKTGQRTYKHQVESNFGTDYKFTIDVEPIYQDLPPETTEE